MNPCQLTGRALLLYSHPAKGLQGAGGALSMPSRTRPCTYLQEPAQGPVVLPALSPLCLPPAAHPTEGMQSGAAAITSQPTSHRAALAGRQLCGKTSASGGERRNPPGLSAAASIHSRENQDVWNKACTKPCQQRVSSTPSLLCGTKVTGVGIC